MPAWLAESHTFRRCGMGCPRSSMAAWHPLLAPDYSFLVMNPAWCSCPTVATVSREKGAGSTCCTQPGHGTSSCSTQCLHAGRMGLLWHPGDCRTTLCQWPTCLQMPCVMCAAPDTFSNIHILCLNESVACPGGLWSKRGGPAAEAVAHQGCWSALGCIGWAALVQLGSPWPESGGLPHICRTNRCCDTCQSCMELTELSLHSEARTNILDKLRTMWAVHLQMSAFLHNCAPRGFWCSCEVHGT